MNRRTALKIAAGATTAGMVAGFAEPATAQTNAGNLNTWFEDVENYDGVVDKTGTETVRIEVGAIGNGGSFAFSPAAIRVDPGATIIWEWTGEGGSHNVAAEDGSYESDLLSDAGATYEHAFTDEGVSRYACTPHESMGMKGAIIIGTVAVGEGTSSTTAEPEYGNWFDGVDNYDGTVDATGQKEVRVTVGAAGNGGQFAFDPATVRVDPGTTVIWEWSGDGGAHNVYDEEVGYASDMLSEAGATYALTFDGEGISRYACAPHESMGMKGAIAVGDLATGGISITAGVAAVGGSLLMALLSPIAFGIFLFLKGTGDPPGAGRPTDSVKTQPSKEPYTRTKRESVRLADSDSIE
ncbi:halocyanin domain-containing protein [Halococcus sp. AFM35]|uniref:halocyanin domain-containing protein n=1 Tax=Halococcus sp. AFM35 TaxID=3421653 RepID=UPI003EB80BF8